DAYDWGAVNRVVDHERIEHEALAMAATIATKSPQAVRMLKFAFNLADDGLMGQQVFAGEATRLAYMTDEAAEGRDAFLEKRAPGLSSLPAPQGWGGDEHNGPPPRAGQPPRDRQGRGRRAQDRGERSRREQRGRGTGGCPALVGGSPL